jgi:hypothetical protein
MAVALDLNRWKLDQMRRRTVESIDNANRMLQQTIRLLERSNVALQKAVYAPWEPTMASDEPSSALTPDGSTGLK